MNRAPFTFICWIFCAALFHVFSCPDLLAAVSYSTVRYAHGYSRPFIARPTRAYDGPSAGGYPRTRLTDLFRRRGWVTLYQPQLPLSQFDWTALDARLHSSLLHFGPANDGHRLNIAELRSPHAVELAYQNRAAARKIERVLHSPPLLTVIGDITGLPSTISFRQMQVNVMKKGDRIGPHVDSQRHNAEAICIFSLPGEYCGGTLRFEDRRTRRLKAVGQRPRSLTIAGMDLLHAVDPILEGERRTLIGFLAIDRRFSNCRPRSAVDLFAGRSQCRVPYGRAIFPSG